MVLEIVAGWDSREALGFSAFTYSAIRHTSKPIRFIPLIEQTLRNDGLYSRPHEQRDKQLWCPISDAPMATVFANSRFLVPWLARTSTVLFADGADMLFLRDPAELFALADRKYAVQVVKHRHIPIGTVKMDDQQQTVYPRKNWSSVVLWNLQHPANQRLTREAVNSLPGRDLHRFWWLSDHEIGELPAEWNHLVGADPDDVTPALLHFTEGLPMMPGYGTGRWAEVWWQELAMMDPMLRPPLR